MHLKKRRRVVIIGAGHNALVLATYLGKAGFEVIVLESRNHVGGATSTEAVVFDGDTYLFSTASYLNSLFLRQIVEDLGLERHGYKVLRRNPSSCTPTSDGRVLLLGPDMAFNKEQIGQFSTHDAEAYEQYEHELGELGEWMSKMLTMTPPSGPIPRNLRDVKALIQFARHAGELNRKQAMRLADLLLTDPVTYLNRRFESPVLKATLLPDALIGSLDPSALVLMHHVMGDAGGARGVWGYMEGGMGAISKALAAVCEENGVQIILNTHVHKIACPNEGGAAYRIETSPRSGCSESSSMPYGYDADIVVSGVDPSITFGKLLADERRVDRWRAKVLARKSEGVAMKINMALSGLPNLRVMPNGPDNQPGPQHQGTIHLASSVEYILAARRDYQEGRSSRWPVLEITIPSAVDKTLASAGKHVMGIFGEFVRYDVDKEAYYHEAVLPTLRQHFSNIDDIIVGVQILAPRDIESMFGMPGGCIFHGDISKFRQLGCYRPVPGIADYRVPGLPRVYHCGAGSYPGPSVCGASGRNLYYAILEDLAA